MDAIPLLFFRCHFRHLIFCRSCSNLLLDVRRDKFTRGRSLGDFFFRVSAHFHYHNIVLHGLGLNKIDSSFLESSGLALMSYFLGMKWSQNFSSYSSLHFLLGDSSSILIGYKTCGRR